MWRQLIHSTVQKKLTRPCKETIKSSFKKAMSKEAFSKLCKLN